MSGYSAPDEHDDFLPVEEREGKSLVLRGAWIVLWGLVSFAVNFAQAVAEEVAPLLLLLGAVWWGLLKVVAGLPLQPDMKQYMAYLPERLQAGGYTLTPSGMIETAILLLALVAACRTVDGIIARRT